MASRYITNIFACTAARAVGEESESEDEHSDEEDVQNKEGHAGSLAIIKKTLQGIASRERTKEKLVKDAMEKPFSSEEHSGKQTHSPQSKKHVSRK